MIVRIRESLSLELTRMIVKVRPLLLSLGASRKNLLSQGSHSCNRHPNHTSRLTSQANLSAHPSATTKASVILLNNAIPIREVYLHCHHRRPNNSTQHFTAKAK